MFCLPKALASQWRVQLAYQAPDASKVKVQLWMKGELSARSQRRHG